jgi:RNA polymerase sigma-70 factor (ECF subfamily)
LDPQKLKKEFIRGNKAAFDLIYRDYSKAMYSICLRYAKDSDTAGDVLQEAFIKIYQNRDKFNPEYELGGWIKRIVINEAISQYRRDKKFEFIEDDLYFESEDTSEIMLEENSTKITQILTKILKELPDGYRTVFSLYVLDNLKHQEIAEYLGVSVNTSKTQLAKARNMIKNKLEAYNITSSTIVNG